MIDVLFLGLSVMLAMVVAIIQRSYTKDDPKGKLEKLEHYLMQV